MENNGFIRILLNTKVHPLFKSNGFNRLEHISIEKFISYKPALYLLQHDTRFCIKNAITI